ncbi:MAG: tRNA pseudouridine(38-40) synthase TruA, partial [Alphaproteobacteria bacterium]|nr:tRNA pseudouridine(38-40) synthase TruA [Alphaproteobacteria bacterium]
GEGSWPPSKVKEILEARDRRVAGPTAPACGLYLTGVKFSLE